MKMKRIKQKVYISSLTYKSIAYIIININIEICSKNKTFRYILNKRKLLKVGMCMNKKVIFFSIIIILVVGLIGIIKLTSKPKLEYDLEEVNEIDYMIVKENNKFGVINKNGDVVVKTVYDEIQIPNPSKPIFVCKYNYNTDLNQYNIKVLNEKEEQVLYQYVYVEAIKLNTPNSNIPFEKSVLKYKEKGKYGLINFDGKIIVKAQYDDIESFNYNEGLLLTKKDNKFGVININGAVIVKNKYDVVESDGYYEEGSNYKKSGFIVGNIKDDKMVYGYLNNKAKRILDLKYEQIERIQNLEKNDDIYLVAFENEKAGFYKNNKNLLKHEYEDIGYDFNNNYLVLQKDAKQGLADLNGNIVIDIEYDNIYATQRYINALKGEQIDIIDAKTNSNIILENIVGLSGTANNQYSIAITADEKYRILDTEKNELQQNEYDFLQHLYDEYFIAIQREKYGIVNVDGSIIVDFKYDNIQKLPNTKMIQAYISNKNITSVFLKDKVIASMANCELDIESDCITMQSDTEVKYIDYEGNLIINDEIINKNEYDLVTRFNEYGFAGIKKGEKWGSINKEGQVVIEPTYSIQSNNPSFIGKYYECDLGYGEPFYTCENDI